MNVNKRLAALLAQPDVGCTFLRCRNQMPDHLEHTTVYVLLAYALGNLATHSYMFGPVGAGDDVADGQYPCKVRWRSIADVAIEMPHPSGTLKSIAQINHFPLARSLRRLGTGPIVMSKLDHYIPEQVSDTIATCPE